MPTQVSVLPDSSSGFVFGFPKVSDNNTLPIFNQLANTSIFDRTGPNISPTGFVFGAGRPDQPFPDNNALGFIHPNTNEAPMDSS